MIFKAALILSFSLSVYAFPARSAPYDSLGIKKEGKLIFIIHKVDMGETVYSLSHRYNISQEELISNNPSIRDGLKVGDELKIPYKKVSPDQGGNYQLHTVQPSETLFGIARIYGVSVAQIRDWNNLSGNTISAGQKLKILQTSSTNETDSVKPAESAGKIHIVNKGETIYSIAKMYNISPDDIKKWNQLISNDIRIGQELIVKNNEEKENKDKMVIANDLKINDPAKDKTEVSQKVLPQPVEIKPEKREEKEGDFKKFVERGMAEVIDGSETTKKYLAMHKTAPIGTIMQVKNEMNNLTVFVRVIGKLPDTGDNSNVSIRISKTAYDRLGAIDKRFPVEITYIP